MSESKNELSDVRRNHVRNDVRNDVLRNCLLLSLTFFWIVFLSGNFFVVLIWILLSCFKLTYIYFLEETYIFNQNYYFKHCFDFLFVVVWVVFV